MKLLSTLLGLSLVALAPQAQAQGFKFGLQVGVVKPGGDLDTAMDGKTGLTFGLNGLVDFKGGHALVPRFDIRTIKRSEFGAELKVTEMTIGADYNFYVGGRANEGFYVAAGLGFANGKYEYSEPGFSEDDSKSVISFAAGGGFMFTQNVGAELRYQHASYEVFGETLTAPSINLSVLFRF